MKSINSGNFDVSFVTSSLFLAILVLGSTHQMELDGYNREIRHDCDFIYDNWHSVSEEWKEECYSEVEQRYEGTKRFWSYCCGLCWILPTLLLDMYQEGPP